MPIKWSDTYPARLGVMPRTGTDADVRWFDINPCYVFHPMNAYEDGDRIVLDVARLSHVWRDSMMDFPMPELWRWTINTTTGTVQEEKIDDRPAEFPRVPDSRVGLPHRYGYMMAVPEADGFQNPMSQSGALFKYDRHTGARTDFDVGRGCLPGEPVFVPAAGGTAEDDGYLMTYVYDASTDTSRLIVVDAATMDSTPVATVELPRIPFGFHGNWVDASVAD
jgi:carotenoid cleavage dioxygenase